MNTESRSTQGEVASGARVEVDVSEARRLLWWRHTVTLTRWEAEGILPRSHRVNGRRCWYLDEIEEAKRRLEERELHRRRIAPEKALALAAAGRAARATNRQLRDAAADALAVGGVALVSRVLAPFTPTGRLDDIPNDRKADAIQALLAGAREVVS